MLRYLREKGNTWVLKGLLAFVAVTFVSWGGFTLSQGPAVQGGRVAAWVNETPITVQEYERQYFQQAEVLRRQLGQEFTEEVAARLGLRQRTLANLVTEKLQLQEAERLGIRVTDPEVALRIQELPYFQRGGRFDPGLYRQLLDSNRISPRQFEEDQRQIIIAERLRRYIGMGASVSDLEVREAYRWLNERVRVEAIRLTPALFAKDVPALEGDLKAHYEKNKEAFRVGLQRKAQWWYLPYEVVSPQVSFTEAEVQARYEETRSRYALKDQVSVSQILLKLPPDAQRDAAEEARKKLADLRERILKGADFAALAREHSQDPAAQKGGDLGTFGRGEMLPELEKVAFSLKKGEVSEPLRTAFGYHLIWVRERQIGRQRPLEEVRAEVEKDLREAKARALARRELRTVRYAVEDKKSSPALSGLRLGETGFFERETPPASLPEGEIMAELVFGLKEKGRLSIEKDGEKGVLFVRLLDIREPFIPPLAEVAEKVRQSYLEEKGGEIARNKAEAWLQELREGKRDFARLAKEVGVQVLAPDAFTRTAVPPELGGDAEFVRTVYRLKKGEYARHVSGRDVLLLRCVDPAVLDGGKFAEQEKGLRERLLEERRTLLFLRHMEALRQAAKVRLEAGFAL